ncbi:hypothetical protein C8R45DRAFT_954923 [Mycena sanguinolenta]|nr:hypothetical protein C8R45DRAFT_954923 [Mycena sanguinolenta]
MAAVPFGYNEPDSFTLALLSKDHTPVYPLFRFPITEEHGNLPLFASKTLKILDVVRLAGLFFGVFSFPLDLETEKLPPLVTWISVHEDVSGIIQNADIAKTLKNVSVNEWKGRTIWLRFRGKEPESLCSVADGVIQSLMQAPRDKRSNLEMLRKKFTIDFHKPANICEFTGDALAVELMHVIPYELGSGLLYGTLKAIQSRANTIWDAYEHLLAPLHTNEPVIGNVVLYNHEKWGTILSGGPVRTINNTSNFLVGSTVVHNVADKRHGVLFSTNPRLWLAETVTHSLTAFTKEVSHDLLPSAMPLKTQVKSDSERTAFLISSLADAVTLYLNYATRRLKDQLRPVIERILAKKDALKRKREQEDEEEEGEHLKHKKAKPAKEKATNTKKGPDDGNGDGGSSSGFVHHSPLFSIRLSDLPIKKRTQEQYPSQNIWEGLLTHPDDLLYVEDVDGEDLDEPELMPESKQIIADLYQGLGVSEAVERHAAMHEKALAFLFMLCNWVAYGQSTI